ncbi:hypothetical protein GGF43_003599 [Coemansia sp. RSA 2618]|nr:hypothetical protein GGF43_003599 [Coemansia sp. RSA 2618]
MSRDEKPRGLRARLRQRRARNNSSEDEVRSRPTSLDLGRSIEPAMLRAGMQSLTAVPTRADLYANDSIESGPGSGGLALGEFTAGDEIAEDEEYVHAGQPSGAIVRSPDETASDFGKHDARKRRGRRESSQSMPVYDGSGSPPPPSYSYGVHSDYIASGGSAAHSEYSSDGSASGDEYEGDGDGDGELNAVYLKRNADFHALFRTIPINELLIDDYVCALQRDILVQGRLYLTENFVCFYSNIFGWVTNLIIAFDEIVSIEKRMTALIIPNAIQVSTLHAKHFFGSFMYRDSAYNQLYDLWARSRNEKNDAGVPETGRAEDGDGAGDVSRHREDIMNAYQSLSEDEGDAHGSSQRAARMSSSSSGDEEGTASSSDAFSSGGSESDDSRSPSLSPVERLGKLERESGASNGTNGDSKPRMDSGATAVLDGDVTPQSATDASSIVPQTAPESTVNSTADVTRAVSQVAVPAAKKTSAESIGSFVGPVAATAAAAASVAAVAATTPAKAALGSAGSSKLLARIPKTPEGTDSGMQEPLAAGRKGPGRRAATETLHAPTTCPCGTSGRTAHYSMDALDTTFPLALPLLFRVVFSASVPAAMEGYMSGVSSEELATSCTRRIGECGNSEVRTEGWVPDPDDATREMCIYSYEKPLSFSIGPKSTTVEDTFRIVQSDFGRAVIVEQVVKTPNVPSGSAFFIKIRHCLTWAAGPRGVPAGGWTQYRMTFEVEWVKTSWIKTAIEKSSENSNKQAGEQLEKYIREWIAAHPDKEVKAETYVATAAAAAAAAAAAPEAAAAVVSRRQRKHGRKQKREGSPRGLRMEELLGSASDNRRRAAIEAREPAPETVPLVSGAKASAALNPAAPQPSTIAAARLEGWLSSNYGVASAVVVLAVLLAITNMWRLTRSGSGSEIKSVEQLGQMQSSIDALAAQMTELNRLMQLVLLERQNHA